MGKLWKYCSRPDCWKKFLPLSRHQRRLGSNKKRFFWKLFVALSRQWKTLPTLLTFMYTRLFWYIMQTSTSTSVVQCSGGHKCVFEIFLTFLSCWYMLRMWCPQEQVGLTFHLRSYKRCKLWSRKSTESHEDESVESNESDEFEFFASLRNVHQLRI